MHRLPKPNPIYGIDDDYISKINRFMLFFNSLEFDEMR